MNAAVVVAAGSGERLDAGRPKALVALAGRPLLAHALDRLAAADVFDEVVVVFAPGHHDAFAQVCRGHGVGTLVPGGATRTDSVRSGVAAVGGDARVVAVHDAARALVPPRVIAQTVAAVVDDVIAAAPGLPAADTLKRVERDREVRETLDRRGVWSVHTPQAVRGDVLRDVLAWTGDESATDDLGLVERAVEAGVVRGRIVLVPGDVRDLKVTYAHDLEVAAALLAAEDRPAAPDAVGHSVGDARG